MPLLVQKPSFSSPECHVGWPRAKHRCGVIEKALPRRKVAVPLSERMGLREKVRRKPAPNPVLEAFYVTRKKPPKEVRPLAHALGVG